MMREGSLGMSFCKEIFMENETFLFMDSNHARGYSMFAVLSSNKKVTLNLMVTNMLPTFAYIKRRAMYGK